MTEMIDGLILRISDFLYTPWVPLFLVAAGLTFTICTGFVQFRMVREAFRVVREKPRSSQSGGGKEETSSGLAFLKNKMLWKIVILVSWWNAASHVATPFYGAYQIHELGFSMTFVSVLSILYGVLRSLFSPVIGRYADRHSFGRSTYVCLFIAAAGFLVNCFTVPENGHVFYTAYYCLSALSHAGTNAALVNLIFDYIPAGERRYALAFRAALSGLVGFLSTCAMSPVVTMIQNSGNTLFGMKIYAAQFVSFVALLLTAGLIVYVYAEFVRKNPPRVGREN